MTALAVIQIILYVLLSLALLVFIVFLIAAIIFLSKVRKYMRRMSQSVDNTLAHLRSRGGAVGSVMNLPFVEYIIRKILKRFF